MESTKRDVKTSVEDTCRTDEDGHTSNTTEMTVMNVETQTEQEVDKSLHI